jgi:hypothetical protein
VPDASEPITLTDPDGAVTRVAPWSAWTREQVRRPGGESALVTRLDQGRLWFSSGRRKSPWLHEVHVGPAVVSTPGGRFQVSVEPDGGASVACLAGRTRVAASLEGPVVLGPDQSAAVSSDGLTLVVLDRPGVDVEDPLEEPNPVDDPKRHASDALVEQGGEGVAELAAERRRRWWWVPELTAAAAVVAVFLAAITLFVHRPSPGTSETAITATTRSTLPLDTTAPPTVTSTTAVVTTTAPPTTAAPTTVTTVPPATSSPIRPVSPGATGVGVLQACRRAPGGVLATVRVRHQVGAPSRFEVTVAAVDRSGAPVAQGKATTGALQPGTVGSVDVVVSTDTANVASCTVLMVDSVA